MFNLKDVPAQVFILNTTTNILRRSFQSYWRVTGLKAKAASFFELSAIVIY